MSKMKLLFSFVLMLISVCLISFTYAGYLRSFQHSFYQTSFYLHVGQDSNQMMQDIADAAARHKVDVFFVDGGSSSLDQEVKTLYGTANVPNRLYEELQISTGVYKQLLASDICIQYAPLTEYSVKTMVENECYIMGDLQAAKAFKLELVDQYAGTSPAAPTNVVPIRTMLMIWCLVYAIILLFTLTSVYEFYKEITVRIINGFSVGKLIARKLLLDDLVLILCYLFSYLLLSRFCYVLCYMKYSAALFAGFLLVNSSLYLLLFRFQIRKAFSNANTSPLFSIFFVLVKAAAVALYISLFALDAVNLKQIYMYTKQRGFFETHRNYSYVRLIMPEYQMSDKAAQTYMVLYRTLTARLYEQNAESMLDAEAITFLDDPGVLLSEKAYAYFADSIVLSENIDVSETLSEGKGVILLPPEMAAKKDEVHAFYGASFVIAAYEGGDILTIDMNDTYPNKYLTDPFICIQPSSLQTDMMHRFLIPMYEMDDREINDFLSEELDGNPDGWSFERTNIYECYLSYQDKATNMAIIYTVLLVSLTFLLIFTNVAVLRIYLSSNRQEIVVKLILGNKFLFIFRRILATFALSFLLVFLGELIYFSNHMPSAVFYVVISGAVVLLIDTIVWIAMVKKMILNQITKTLKGGAL